MKDMPDPTKKAAENKAKLYKLDQGGLPQGPPIAVQFNPEQYSKGWDLIWQEVGQTLQWTKTAPVAFTLTLHFDSYEERTNVSDRTKEIRSLLDPSKEKGQYGFLFQWGKYDIFRGVVKSIKEDFTLFLHDGTPVRSVLTLSLQPWPKDMQNPPEAK